MDASSDAEVPLLPDHIPVVMPRLPATLTLTRPEQFRAFGDPVRTRILGVIQQRPATAKQIAALLDVPPGTIGHHLQVLEAAGLARVVARRLVRGIVAKYYTRTARIFDFDPESSREAREAGDSAVVDFLGQARDELAEAVAAYGLAASLTCGYPRVRLSAARAGDFKRQLSGLLDEFMAEEPDPGGTVYSLAGALFVAPPFVQGVSAAEDAAGGEEDADGHGHAD
jgi:DNA-binding transcriptional ArsR family regulator